MIHVFIDSGTTVALSEWDVGQSIHSFKSRLNKRSLKFFGPAFWLYKYQHGNWKDVFSD
jgi:hypothetical protein